MIFLIIFSDIIFSTDSQVEVVESPYWIFTYLYFGFEIVILILALYSVIKIQKTNKNLIKEKTNQTTLYADRLSKERLPNDEEKQLKRSGRMVVKRKFGWMYAPDKHEKWLEEMEKKGFNLYRVGVTGNVFYFIIGKPRKVSYCADYQTIADESSFDIHSEAGWKMVFNSLGSLQKWTIWSREFSEGDERPQIYSDKTNQLKHARRIALTYSCIFLPLVILYLLNIRFKIEMMADGNIDRSSIFTVIMMLILILSFGSYSIRTWLYYRRLKKACDL
ncbi:MAG: DUF2812 domain-containing protein [Bacillus sp. (in: Bacteria)]|nr:DUF2812 domain-containing protein [Bacillus sp. (in: firmicutes)]